MYRRSLEEHIALVTGGARGLGNAIVEELLKNGVQGVVIADILEDIGNEVVEKFNAKYGDNRVAFIKTDVADEDQFEAAFKFVISTYGSLNVLINNAGVLNDENWKDMISVNATAVLSGCFLAMKYIGSNNGGKGGIVLNVSSILGLRPLPGSPVYTATKHFIVGLTRCLGTTVYYKDTGVKFVVVCPGMTLTTFARSVLQNQTVVDDVNSIEKVKLEELRALPPQTPEAAAEKMCEVIFEADNGSVWVIEDGEAYEVEIPSRNDMRKQK